jgi:hypothetical protein
LGIYQATQTPNELQFWIGLVHKRLCLSPVQDKEIFRIQKQFNNSLRFDMVNTNRAIANLDDASGSGRAFVRGGAAPGAIWEFDAFDQPMQSICKFQFTQMCRRERNRHGRGYRYENVYLRRALDNGRFMRAKGCWLVENTLLFGFFITQ